MIHFFNKTGEEGGEPIRLRQLLEKLVNDSLILQNRNINIILTDDETITTLHGGFLGDNSTTDVIAFDLGEDLPRNQNIPEEVREEDVWGEVYIDTEQAQRQAAENGNTLNREIALLAVHGLLHLAGNNDDTPQAKQAMLLEGEKIVSDFEKANSRFGS